MSKVYLELTEHGKMRVFVPGGVAGVGHHVTLPATSAAWEIVVGLMKKRASRTPAVPGAICQAKIGEPEAPTQRMVDQWLTTSGNIPARAGELRTGATAEELGL
jgi:hypothetical protein